MYKKIVILFLCLICSTANAQNVVRVTNEAQHPLRHKSSRISWDTTTDLTANSLTATSITTDTVNYTTLNPAIDFSSTVQYCNGHPELYDVCLEWDDVALSLWIGGQNQGQWPYPALDYIAEYTDDNAIYEGWAVYVTGGVDTSELVWRIAKNTFTGANKTRTAYAGAGEFQYAWVNRSNYFDSGVAQYLLIDSDNYLIIDDEGHKVRIQ